MRKFGIKHIRTAPHNPTGNSIVERINRENSLCLRLSRTLSLKKTSEKIHTRLNLTHNSALGFSPYEVFFKKPLFDKIVSDFRLNDEEIKKVSENNQKRWSSRKISNSTQFKENDLVYVKINNSDKIVQKYEGPYKIEKLSKSKNNAFILKENK
ncbi:hypothetical protein DMUE_6227, partial [Dictyocoela muelleri]